MRLFLAIELPDAVRTHLEHVQGALRDKLGKASWTKPDSLHITLKFLGEVDDRDFPPLDESLRLIRTGGAMGLHADGVECFPNRGPVRLVAARMAGDDAPVRALHQSIEQRCQYLGFEREGRAYRPHVTIARARPVLPPATRETAEQQTANLWPGPTFEVGEFVLFESRLKPDGAQYLPLARYPLA